ncbi:OmpA/MotB family protein [Clostridium mediterraneense]|uniref:OmpA/MotB family protein n=1 Tax=Clostridium mediterraneense TaxID=1805472 RepID=UPI0008351B22|nr:OmpA family protein [Clostridium mediterraneense]
MKLRRKRYRHIEENPSYWPSFVDIMSITSLVFFFIMILAMGFLTVFVDDISAKREVLYDKIEYELNQNKVDPSIIRFNRDEGKIDIKTETFFDTDSAMLKDDGKQVAAMFRDVFYNLLDVKDINKEIDYIEIVGHTDYSGDTFSNRELSTMRAVNFLNEIMPMNSELENKFGDKFKASGMSEFETNRTVEERNRSEENYNKDDYIQDRKIEIKMVFSNKDLEEAIKQRLNSNKKK